MTIDNITRYIEVLMQGETPASFKDPAAIDLISRLGMLTPQEIYQVGAATIQFVLASQLAFAHVEREIQLMRDR
jgi:hypothetical protein